VKLNIQVNSTACRDLGICYRGSTIQLKPKREWNIIYPEG